MEFEQLVNRLEWLDEERRKDKNAIAALQEGIKNIEGELKTAQKKIKEITAEIQKTTNIPARLDQLETALDGQRTEILKHVDALDEKHGTSHKEADKRIQDQFKNVSKSSAEINKLKTPIADLKRQFTMHAEDENRRTKMLSEWEVRMESMVQVAEQVQRAQVILEESRKNEIKRMADLQGDVSAARKRMDETREKYDLFSDDIRRLELRLNEVITSEADRKQSQMSFIETQSLAQVERDRAWKSWENSLDTLKKNNELIEHHLQEWELALRGAKRAQETYEDLVQKFERRINEISEMQRLTEDRLRQEWVTFKADEQKRWSSFNLSQDETRKDLVSELDKLRSHLAELAEQSQTLQDLFNQTREANEQLFQGMLSQVNELLSTYGRIAGRNRV
jgi:chromosome segregation ATPase